MAPQRQNIINHAFFPSTSSGAVVSIVDKQRVFVDVGGTGDCGFRSIAAGFIDNILTQPSKMRGEFLKRVLSCHFNYFPKYRISSGLVKPAERMEQLVRTVRMGELVQTLAYTMRQIAVDELCAHPELYRGAFVKRHEQTSPKDMRQPTTWIDESSIAALSNALQMPIDVLLGDNNHTLQKRLRYNQGLVNPGVTLRLQGDHYVPCVHNSEPFGLVKSQTERLFQYQVDHTVVDPSLSDILLKIAAEDKRLIMAFEATYHRLTFMVANEELSKDDLLAIYIKGMGTSDYLSKRSMYASVEHGHQDFFNLILRAQKGETSVMALDDRQNVNELIHAISRAISIGHMSDDVIDIKANLQSRLAV